MEHRSLIASLTLTVDDLLIPASISSSPSHLSSSCWNCLHLRLALYFSNGTGTSDGEPSRIYYLRFHPHSAHGLSLLAHWHTAEHSDPNNCSFSFLIDWHTCRLWSNSQLRFSVFRQLRYVPPQQTSNYNRIFKWTIQFHEYGGFFISKARGGGKVSK